MDSPLSACPDSDQSRRALARVAVVALLMIGIARAALYLVYAFLEIPASDQPFHLEQASVYFASCVQRGLPLYPASDGPSYTVNYLGPCYFWLVGALGRLLGADLAMLHVIGRVVTFVCGLGPAVIAAVDLHRRYGRLAAVTGLALGVGAGPMIVYGVMTRPDMMADLLGAGGFFVACRAHRRWLPLAVVLLALGCLTKQTAGAWLLAAILVLLLDANARRRALVLGGATAATIMAAVACLAVTYEPHLVSSLFAQGVVRLDARQQMGIVLLMVQRAPDLLIFPLIGCQLWLSREHKDRTLLILTAVWLIVAVVTCAKRGSDLNYFVPLRIIEALAAGTLCMAALRSPVRLRWTLLILAGIGAMVPGTAYVAQTLAAAASRHAALPSESALIRQEQFQRLVDLARNPEVRMLTDCDRLAIYQGPRAVLFDAFLFRCQVEAGNLDPHMLVDRLQSRWFQYVVLTPNDVGADHEVFFYRLPDRVTAAIQANYRLASQEAGQLVYVPCDPSQ